LTTFVSCPSASREREREEKQIKRTWAELAEVVFSARLAES